MKKILILADSPSLPRLHPEICEYEDTWPYLLKMDFLVHQVSIGGATISDLVRQMEYHKMVKPDFIILQCGIVDCAPRALSLFELELVKRIWGLRSILLPFIKRNNKWIRKVRKATNTDPFLFKKELTKLLALNSKTKFLGVGILQANSEYEEIVPGISVHVAQYNKILVDALGKNFISLDQLDRSGIMSDHIHLNKAGQLAVFNKIASFLKSEDA
jgi:lysophospholipase L1-like esterase